ncbi:MAG: pyrroloquinoline quinone biosynthesis peptide chaperone PqqD [Marinobacter sp.]|uniref:pyrroloquinoline quinone biosynthesis peptide chaperone PqqD n=1 Tax=Marinobacter sp. TaxID=50741 RepID=UPI0029C219BE|nr:pyrroloquinoline quinone biosynthesis peptide chaperone PqqD [Marinobacter sp.]MDX5337289.1 pyrroloquinoline quinone biosynthesis peptide chaperone PqqD [Marinobacter sp.]MDX5388597.1 pyrroloquinoline quinone biosynthesis peptide chaperone PqqD [Marinobacter sp.]MDX5439014.1 pyrroloquinoline quinone biosynthesis peptide chaperone PqqD [Alteromonadaceae bacterium]MDX5473798.1 pyrroloquinoline quinone biosynthesis peptide chaperone PqqD [Marinobacter sp.]
MTLEKTPRLRRGFRFQWEPVQQSHVLLYPEGMVKLNGSAGAILAEVDGVRPIHEIIHALEQQFPDAGPLADDVEAFLAEAVQQQWIEWS